MSIRHFLPIMAAVILAIVGAAAQQSEKLTMKVGKTHPADGKLMYAEYCASCHGMDGKGYGPVASSLKVPPPDLTQLSKSNHGKYPWNRVSASVEFGAATPAHGTALMPVWGPVFDSMNTSAPSASSIKYLRIRNLTEYIRSLQAD